MQSFAVVPIQRITDTLANNNQIGLRRKIFSHTSLIVKRIVRGYGTYVDLDRMHDSIKSINAITSFGLPLQRSLALQSSSNFRFS